MYSLPHLVYQSSFLIATALYVLNISALHKRHSSREMRALLFDAGSTGTRLHVFTFYNNSDGKLELRREDYFHTTPGISSFALTPQKAKASVLSLLNEAKKVVPGKEWQNIPVAFKATAGVRLLPKDQAHSLMHEIHNALKDAKLRVIDNETVSIMDGEDEGFFAWYTVNFLLGRLNNSANSVTILDLGGGSVQVAFRPNNQRTLKSSPKSHLTTRRVLGKRAPLYVRSYLGFGLMAARLAILQSTSNSPETHTLTSPCLHPNASLVWTMQGIDFRVMGMPTQIYNYSACYQHVKEFVKDNVFSPEELQTKELFAVSYFYDRAVDSGLTDHQIGGTVSLSDFLRASTEVCSNHNEDQPFLCMDLTYITTLLHNGFGLNLDKNITLVKTIDSVEVSWVLGAAFNHLR